VNTAATMADWLLLHDLSAGLCREILATVPPDDSIASPLPKLGKLDLPADAIWRDIAASLKLRLPFAVPEITETLGRTRTDFAPDRKRFPRAFTLNDADGAPFVSCPCDGEISDLLVLSHEFGHALQLVASLGRPLAPVARETCAYLCERWYLAQISILSPEVSAKITLLSQAKHANALRTGIPRLKRALNDPDARYSYQWNYPLARIFSRTLGDAVEPAAIWPLFAAEITLPELARMMPHRH
jgi:hypothetical protein